MKRSSDEASHARSLIDRLREFRHKPDVLLHRRRRDDAHRHLAGIVPRSVLFLCHGNICRSPFAAAAFRKALPEHLANQIEVDSGGFIGPGRHPPAGALIAAGRRGIDLSLHKSKVVTAKLLHDADLIVVMAAQQSAGVEARGRPGGARILVLGDLDPEPITRRTITDPWNREDAVFEASYQRIGRCVEELARLISAVA